MVDTTQQNTQIKSDNTSKIEVGQKTIKFDSLTPPSFYLTAISSMLGSFVKNDASRRIEIHPSLPIWIIKEKGGEEKLTYPSFRVVDLPTEKFIERDELALREIVYIIWNIAGWLERIRDSRFFNITKSTELSFIKASVENRTSDQEYSEKRREILVAAEYISNKTAAPRAEAEKTPASLANLIDKIKSDLSWAVSLDLWNGTLEPLAETFQNASRNATRDVTASITTFVSPKNLSEINEQQPTLKVIETRQVFREFIIQLRKILKADQTISDLAPNEKIRERQWNDVFKPEVVDALSRYLHSDSLALFPQEVGLLDQVTRSTDALGGEDLTRISNFIEVIAKNKIIETLSTKQLEPVVGAAGAEAAATEGGAETPATKEEIPLPQNSDKLVDQISEQQIVKTVLAQFFLNELLGVIFYGKNEGLDPEQQAALEQQRQELAPFINQEVTRSTFILDAIKHVLETWTVLVEGESRPLMSGGQAIPNIIPTAAASIPDFYTECANQLVVFLKSLSQPQLFSWVTKTVSVAQNSLAQQAKPIDEQSIRAIAAKVAESYQAGKIPQNLSEIIASYLLEDQKQLDAVGDQKPLDWWLKASISQRRKILKHLNSEKLNTWLNGQQFEEVFNRLAQEALRAQLIKAGIDIEANQIWVDQIYQQYLAQNRQFIEQVTEDVLTGDFTAFDQLLTSLGSKNANFAYLASQSFFKDFKDSVEFAFQAPVRLQLGIIRDKANIILTSGFEIIPRNFDPAIDAILLLAKSKDDLASFAEALTSEKIKLLFGLDVPNNQLDKFKKMFIQYTLLRSRQVGFFGLLGDKNLADANLLEIQNIRVVVAKTNIFDAYTFFASTYGQVEDYLEQTTPAEISESLTNQELEQQAHLQEHQNQSEGYWSSLTEAEKKELYKLYQAEQTEAEHNVPPPSFNLIQAANHLQAIADTDPDKLDDRSSWQKFNDRVRGRKPKSTNYQTRAADFLSGKPIEKIGESLIPGLGKAAQKAKDLDTYKNIGIIILSGAPIFAGFQAFINSWGGFLGGIGGGITGAIIGGPLGLVGGAMGGSLGFLGGAVGGDKALGWLGNQIGVDLNHLGGTSPSKLLFGHNFSMGDTIRNAASNLFPTTPALAAQAPVAAETLGPLSKFGNMLIRPGGTAGFTITTASVMTVMVINTVHSSFLAPLPTIGGDLQESKYVAIVKSADTQNADDPVDLTYKVSIEAKPGYQITIISAEDKPSIITNKEKNPTGKTSLPTDTNYKTFQEELQKLVGKTIGQDGNTKIELPSYSWNFGEDKTGYDDSSITNSINLTFSVAGTETVASTTAVTSEIVCFGECPKANGQAIVDQSMMIVTGLKQAWWAFYNYHDGRSEDGQFGVFEYINHFSMPAWKEMGGGRIPCTASCPDPGPHDGEPNIMFWCTWNVIYSFYNAGQPIVDPNSPGSLLGVSGMRAYFVRESQSGRAEYISNPIDTQIKPGDVAFFRKGTDKDAHVAIVDTVTRTQLFTLDSNNYLPEVSYTINLSTGEIEANSHDVQLNGVARFK